MNFKLQSSYPNNNWNDFVVIFNKPQTNNGILQNEKGVQITKKDDWYWISANGNYIADVIIPDNSLIGRSNKIYYIKHIGYTNAKPITEEMYLDAIAQKDDIINNVPINMLEVNFWIKAVRKNTSVLRHLVSFDVNTRPIYEVAMTKNDWSLRYLPYNVRSKKYCDLSVAKNPKDEQYIPPEMR
jgi:hypothetical protein